MSQVCIETEKNPALPAFICVVVPFGFVVVKLERSSEDRGAQGMEQK